MDIISILYFFYASAASTATAALSTYFFFFFPYREKPLVIRCGAPGCSNVKKYNCSKTGIPLCSLQCYKSNFSANKSVIAT